MHRSNPRDSVFRTIYTQNLYQPSMYMRNISCSLKDSVDFVQRLGLYKRLPIHTGCVNTVVWNDSGEHLLSGSDDQCICITNPFDGKVLMRYSTPHRSNIFSARFLPQCNDTEVVTCSGDGVVIHTQLLEPNIRRVSRDESIDSQTYERSDPDATSSTFTCHKNGTAYEVTTIPTEPRTFMSCGEDGTVRLFDLRQVSQCHQQNCMNNVIINCPAPVNAMDISPISHTYIAIGCSDAIVRVFDRRFLKTLEPNDLLFSNDTKYTRPLKAYTIPLQAKRPYRVTSVKFSPEETEILASFSSEYLYLFNFADNGIDINKIGTKSFERSEQLTCEQISRRLRLRGDWSDTGPNARPDRISMEGHVELGQARPRLHSNLMSRMTNVISRMLNEPRTRNSLSGNPIIPERDGEIGNVSFVGPIDQGPHRASSIYDESSSNEQNNESESTTATNETNTSNVSQSESKQMRFPLAEQKKLYKYLMMKYTGHRNARTMIKECNFWGTKYVISGSDCGHIFFWNRRNGKLVMLLEADQHVVNCLQPHPNYPYLVSSGIDYDVKVWSPISDEKNFDEEMVKDLTERNAIMLEQTKDTVTVPAAFMIRMLACIHSLRRREQSTSNENNEIPANVNGNNNGNVAANNVDAAANDVNNDDGNENVNEANNGCDGNDGNAGAINVGNVQNEQQQSNDVNMVSIEDNMNDNAEGVVNDSNTDDTIINANDDINMDVGEIDVHNTNSMMDADE